MFAAGTTLVADLGRNSRGVDPLVRRTTQRIWRLVIVAHARRGKVVTTAIHGEAAGRVHVRQLLRLARALVVTRVLP